MFIQIVLEKLTIYEQRETKRGPKNGPRGSPRVIDNELTVSGGALISSSAKVSKCWKDSVSSSSQKSWHPRSGYMTPVGLAHSQATPMFAHRTPGALKLVHCSPGWWHGPCSLLTLSCL